MKILQGVITGLVFLITFLLSLFVLAVVIGAVPQTVFSGIVIGLYTDSVLRLVLGIVAGVMIILSLVLLVCMAQPSGPSAVQVDTTPDGKIGITLEAVNEMVVRTAKGVENIKEVTASISANKDNSVTIRMSVWLRAEVSISTTVSALQTAVKEYVEQIAGLRVSEVRVMVEKTSAK